METGFGSSRQMLPCSLGRKLAPPTLVDGSNRPPFFYFERQSCRPMTASGSNRQHYAGRPALSAKLRRIAQAASARERSFSRAASNSRSSSSRLRT